MSYSMCRILANAGTKSAPPMPRNTSSSEQYSSSVSSISTWSSSDLRKRASKGAQRATFSRAALSNSPADPGGDAGYSFRFSFVTSFGAGSTRPSTVISTYRAMSANVRFSAIFKPCSSTTALASA